MADNFGRIVFTKYGRTGGTFIITVDWKVCLPQASVPFVQHVCETIEGRTGASKRLSCSRAIWRVLGNLSGRWSSVSSRSECPFPRSPWLCPLFSIAAWGCLHHQLLSKASRLKWFGSTAKLAEAPNFSWTSAIKDAVRMATQKPIRIKASLPFLFRRKWCMWFCT